MAFSSVKSSSIPVTPPLVSLLDELGQMYVLADCQGTILEVNESFLAAIGHPREAVEGQPFHDPAADTALREGLADGLEPGVELHELDLTVNDEAFAVAMADRLHEMVQASWRGAEPASL